jgi:sugar phosphate isomerase/epimerase
MKLGIGSYAFRWAIGVGTFRPSRPLRAPAFIEKAASLGVRLVQFADNLPLDDISSHELDEVRVSAEELGVEVELGTRGLDERRLRRYADIAQVLGARLVRIAVDRDDVVPSPSAMATRLINVFSVFLARNLDVAIENHFFIPSSFLADTLRTIANPHVGACLDTGNSLMLWEQPLDTTRRLAPYALSLHLKDFTTEPDPDGVGFRVIGTPLGRGSLNAAVILGTLKGVGRNVNVILEHWLPKSDDQRATLDREVAWLRESIAAARQLGVTE